MVQKDFMMLFKCHISSGLHEIGSIFTQWTIIIDLYSTPSTVPNRTAAHITWRKSKNNQFLFLSLKTFWFSPRWVLVAFHFSFLAFWRPLFWMEENLQWKICEFMHAVLLGFISAETLFLCQ